MKQETSRNLSIGAVVVLSILGAPFAESVYSGDIWKARFPIEVGRSLPEVLASVRETTDQITEGRHPLVSAITSVLPLHPLAQEAN